MKGRDKSSAFFKQGNSKIESDGDSGGLTGMFKSARASGKLILCGRSLTVVPDEVFVLATTLGEGEKFWETNPLTKLDLGSNLLRHIPEGKFDLLKFDLAYLQLKDNKFESLPNDIFACDMLKYLNLSTNALIELNESVGGLKDLRELFVADNKLVTLPTSLSFCKHLQTLELQNNMITRIPLGSLLLPQLLKLDLSSNKLTEIPISISELLLLGEIKNEIYEYQLLRI
jgi:Leucine rich repeat/Leucine Rich repeats (2 copies)